MCYCGPSMPLIPANDADRDMTHQATANPTALRDVVDGDHVAKGDFLTWLISGSWQQILNILTPVLVVLLLFRLSCYW